MRVVGCVAALALVVVSVVPASAMNWSIGPNLGYARIKPAYPNATSSNSFAWPNGGVLTPGLRIGFMGQNPMHEVYLDTDLSIFSTSGASSRSFTTRANYQYNFSSSGSVAPYLTAGVGFVLSGDKVDAVGSVPGIDESATGGVFGGGVGIRHKMGNGHGVCRGEVRFDRTTEGTDSNVIIIPKANIVSVKLGVDLWDK